MYKNWTFSCLELASFYKTFTGMVDGLLSYTTVKGFYGLILKSKIILFEHRDCASCNSIITRMYNV